MHVCLSSDTHLLCPYPFKYCLVTFLMRTKDCLHPVVSSPCEVVLEHTHEDDDNKAQQQHHQHQRVDDGQPVDLQRLREERVIAQALGPTRVCQGALEPADTVCVSQCQARRAAHAANLVQGHGLNVLH